MDINLEELSITELIELYAKIPEELKERGVLRTNNFTGDLGEYLAIDHYNQTPGLPNLQAAPTGTQNIDAISRKGERYSIKAIRGDATGVFYGLQDPESNEIDSQKFEYVIIVQFFDNLKIRRVIELNWETFINNKRWHRRMRAWYLGISKKLIKESKLLIENSNG